MANMSIRRNQPREQLAAPSDPLRGSLFTLDPFRMIRDIMGADPFAGLVAPTGGLFAPDIEIKETKDAYVMKADLPGIRDQDLEVSVVGNRLTISGKREEEQREEDDRYFAYERTYGSFSRSFTLPEGADLDKIKADLREGVLTVEIPKHAEMQARRVQIGGKPSEGKPQQGKTEAGKPEAGKPEGGKPEGGKPEGGKPEGGPRTAA
jgi:HSP20 family protein